MSGLTLIRTDRAATVCKLFDLRCGAERLLAPAHTPAQFLELLIERDFHANAIRFLAHALPVREAVWWASLCLRLAKPERLPDAEEKALASVVRWVVKPTAEHRAQAEARAAAAENTAAGSLARAVAVSVEGRGPTPGAGAMNCRAIAAAVQAASDLNGAEFSGQYALKFLAVGTEIANGKHHWP